MTKNERDLAIRIMARLLRELIQGSHGAASHGAKAKAPRAKKSREETLKPGEVLNYSEAPR